MNRQRWWVAGAGLVIVLTARLCYLVIRYGGAAGVVKRPHIESAALLLAIVGLIVRLTTDRPLPAEGDPVRTTPLLWVLVTAGAFALYWPALTIGLLSDDFILFDHARVWDVGQVAPQLLRPLPIFVWAVVVHLGGGPAALHLVNVLLHGTNAYLAGRVAGGWLHGRWVAPAASLLFLTAPLAPEAVAWCSGCFDLFATMWMLCAVLVARRAGARTIDRVLLAVVAVAALLSKETAVVLPLLLVIDWFVTQTRTRTAAINIAAVAALALVFGAIRIQSATPVETSFSRYRVQRLVFDSFGALAAPWHVNDPWLPTLRAAYASCVVAVIAVFFVSRGPRQASTAVLGGAGWVLASILPLLAFFYVGPALEGARYLYLASCGWAVVLVASSEDAGRRGRTAAAAVAIVLFGLIAAGAWGVRNHLEPWQHAAQTRDLVLARAAGDERLRACSVADIEGLPDSVEGAYLFANGALEALANVGVTAFARPGTGACAFRWDADSSTFRAVSARER